MDGASADAGSPNALAGTLRESSFLGETSEHIVEVGQQALRVVCSPPRFNLPERLTVRLDPGDLAVFPSA
jgi:hypothetical protein